MNVNKQVQVKVAQVDFKKEEGIIATAPLNANIFLHSPLCLILNESSGLNNWPGKRPGSLTQLFQAPRLLLPCQWCHLDPISSWLLVPQIETVTQNLELDHCLFCEPAPLFPYEPINIPKNVLGICPAHSTGLQVCLPSPDYRTAFGSLRQWWQF